MKFNSTVKLVSTAARTFPLDIKIWAISVEHIKQNHQNINLLFPNVTYTRKEKDEIKLKEKKKKSKDNRFTTISVSHTTCVYHTGIKSLPVQNIATIQYLHVLRNPLFHCNM